MLMSAVLPGTEAMVEALRGFVTWRHPHVTVAEMCATSSSPVYLVRPCCAAGDHPKQCRYSDCGVGLLRFFKLMRLSY